MTSKRKLEEKIAESKDPVIRKQLQELLELRNKRSNQRKDKVVNFVKELNPELTKAEQKKNEKLVLIIVAGTIIGAILVFLLLTIISP